ncbi:MAG: HypC/HybG/HupF family hydrogenase formation chaperone, partial [Candidatus Thermoplasmatota archaeon]|nr:HypC/HybG/HupF family hydrogenase formation chaperone [Candidatus Thermoplasmatota archaeon]
IMCLAVPGKVVEISGDHAKIEYTGGIMRQANITMVKPEIGQYVIVHAGFAIQILEEKDAMETLALWNEMLDADNLGGDGGGGA